MNRNDPHTVKKTYGRTIDQSTDIMDSFVYRIYCAFCHRRVKTVFDGDRIKRGLGSASIKKHVDAAYDERNDDE